MPEVEVKNLEGGPAGRLSLDENVFGAKANVHVLRATLRAQMANQRQGTVSTKTRGEVSGGGRKPWRQKGTGRARAGSSRSPIWKGGGVTFGPKPRSFGEKVNRKVRQAALRGALSRLCTENRLIVTQDLEIAEPKTKRVAELVARLEGGKKTLFLTAGSNPNLERGARNLAKVKVLRVENLNVRDLLHFDTVIASVDVVRKLAEVYG